MYTEDELLQEWKSRLGLLEQDCGCTVSCHDGKALDAVLKSRLRSWYARQLRHAPGEWLPCQELSDEVEWARTDEQGELRLLLPERGGRPLSLKLRGWRRAIYRFCDPGSVEEALSRFPGLRPTVDEPLAILDGRVLRAMPAPERMGDTADDVEELLMTASPGEGLYELSEALLDQLPKE